MISIQTPFSPHEPAAYKGDSFQQPEPQVRFRQLEATLGPNASLGYRLTATYPGKLNQVI